MILLYTLFASSILLGGLMTALSISKLETATNSLRSFHHSSEHESQNATESELPDSY